MTGQRHTCASSFVWVALAACLPLDDLAGYSSDPVGMFAAGTGSGGASGAADAGSSGAGSGGTSSGEGMAGSLSLDPSMGNSGASVDAGNQLPGEVPDAGACNGDGEFAGADESTCYRSTAETAVWLDARAACQTWGGDLVQIESAAEDELLTARLTTDVWLGLSDREVEGTMLWVDGSALVYANWGGAQPDDFDAQEDCAEKRAGEAGAWNDRPCDGDAQEFLCER